MKRIIQKKRLIALALGVLGIIILLASCARLEAPTASQTSFDPRGNLWNPQPGDVLIPGREIPFLNPNYWDEYEGYGIDPSANSVTAVIGPNGGRLRLGRHTLTVPAGAVNNNVTFTMSYASLTAVGVDLFPSRTFQVPVTLSLSYQNTNFDNDGNDPSSLAVIFLPDNGSPVFEPSNVNITDKTVSADLTHFSRYIVG